jgi:hypothetical protein
MLILELFTDTDRRVEKDDNSPLKMSDVRKTRLSLAHINTIRMARDVRKFEQEEKAKNVSKQYSVPAESAAGGLSA